MEDIEKLKARMQECFERCAEGVIGPHRDCEGEFLLLGIKPAGFLNELDFERSPSIKEQLDAAVAAGKLIHEDALSEYAFRAPYTIYTRSDVTSDELDNFLAELPYSLDVREEVTSLFGRFGTEENGWSLPHGHWGSTLSLMLGESKMLILGNEHKIDSETLSQIEACVQTGQLKRNDVIVAMASSPSVLSFYAQPDKLEDMHAIMHMINHPEHYIQADGSTPDYNLGERLGYRPVDIKGFETGSSYTSTEKEMDERREALQEGLRLQARIRDLTM